MDAKVADPPVVLFVDDEVSILSALRRLFRPQGYRVLLAESAKAGLAMLETEPVDLVVSDMRMPEMDGAALLEQVHQRWPTVGRILLTGYADIGSTVAAINRGQIHRYIAKPWDDRELVMCVQDGLERRRLEKENRALQLLTQRQNDELQALNTDLAARVKARTSELEQVNAMLETSFAQLQENFLLSINVFSGLIELRGGGMAGYSREVADLARRTARRLNLGAAAEEDIYITGLLHEVGKIGLPDTMLRKPLSAMSSDELALYRRYPLNGEAALLPLGRLQRVARLVRSHHERIDGKGYPDALSGDEVPLGAQVVSVACDYYAAQSGRLSLKRHSAAEAHSLILGGAGTRYEKAVVEAFELALKDEPSEKPRDRELQPHEVMPGMVLSRDLLSPQGTLLLAAGFVFDNRVVRQLREFAGREGAKLHVFVKLPEGGAT
ncbi:MULTISPECIES: HD domain-containing phosphohydrolase [unclassified Roseateles]|uniref:HD domain-containing phosphohydrolase n=1 Tax=Pelomonas sp. Root1237 TaxID=1736434 RepID=UPI0006FD56A5|nr:HD domain-containing phosphohydrolase [Pelomonas sp. Root1237]KQV94091.1 two-component system response regulator [Pelomonas sp. Root1237]